MLETVLGVQQEFESGIYVVNSDGSLSLPIMSIQLTGMQQLDMVENSFTDDPNCLGLPSEEQNLNTEDRPNDDRLLSQSKCFSKDKIQKQASPSVEDSYTDDLDYVHLECEILNNEENRPIFQKKRKKGHQVNNNSWNINKNKTARKLGQEYKGKRKVEGKWSYNVQKNVKQMKSRCKCNRKEGSVIQCSSVTESDRERNFKEYWKLEWGQKKYFARSLTKMVLNNRYRDRTDAAKSKRQFSCIYYLKQGIGKIRVCKTMYIITLSIGEWTALNWQKDFSTSGDEDTQKDCRDQGRNQKISRKPEDKKVLEEFFSSLSKVESHYCRASSTRLYLEPTLTSKLQLGLYEFYKEDWCKEKDVEPLSMCTFSQMFEDANLSLFTSKRPL